MSEAWTKTIEKATKEIAEAFKLYGVMGASEAFKPYSHLAAALRDSLKGKIPMIFIERIVCIPQWRDQQR